MKKKIFALGTVLTLSMSLLVTGCGDKDSDEEKSDKVIDDISEKDSDEDFDEEYQEDDVDEEEESIEYSNIENFSDGLAWVSMEHGKYQCIDTKGESQFAIDCISVKDFINGYAVIDNTIVIDADGKEVYDFGAEDYELYSVEPLDVGCVILTKEIDTYEKSGLFYFVLDVEKKEIVEMDFSECAFYTASQEWSEYYKEGGHTVMPCEYLGNGYYSLQIVSSTDLYTGDIGRSNNYRMIQWYDVKNQTYVNIDTGIEYADGDLADTTLYYETPDENILCAYVVHEDKTFFLDKETCSVKNVVEGQLKCSGYDYNVVGVYEEDYMMICYDEEDNAYILDMAKAEKFPMKTEYEEDGYEVLSYKDGYFCIDLQNDVGSHYLAVIDKNGNTVYEPTAYDSECLFRPQFFEETFIYYNGTEMCFVSMSNWEIENQHAMQLTTIDSFDPDSYDKVSSAFCIESDTEEGRGIFINYNYVDTTCSYYESDGTVIEENSNKWVYRAPDHTLDGYLKVSVDGSDNYVFVDYDLEELKMKLK